MPERHRLLLWFEGRAEGEKRDDILDERIKKVLK